MAQTIKCTHCGKEIEISEALTHQLEEQITSAIEIKHKKELEEFKAELEKKATKELQEQTERNKNLARQINELLDEIRALRRKDEERELEMKKRLVAEEDKIRQEAARLSDEEHKLKDLEKDKKIADLMRSLEDAQKKAAQGSQQTQGESLELALEEGLKKEFPLDAITEVKKGQRGADILQKVVDKLDRECGSIVWESKNAKWSESWISKLKEDQRSVHADIAVLVTVDLPKNIETYSYINGVWIVSWKYYLPLALSLRYTLVALFHEKQSQEGKEEKMKILYEYLTGHEFKHRVEAIAEAFGNMQDELEREKRWFATKWARQEKQIRKALDHTHGFYGDLQGVIGKQLPELSSQSLPTGEQEALGLEE
jgi:hypothetical protein